MSSICVGIGGYAWDSRDIATGPPDKGDAVVLLADVDAVPRMNAPPSLRPILTPKWRYVTAVPSLVDYP